MLTLTGRHMFQRMGMQDTCKIGAYTDVGTDADDPGANDNITYPLGLAMRCNVDLGNPQEVTDGTQISMTDGTIYIPAGTTIDRRDRIKLTHYNGVALDTAEWYAVLGYPKLETIGIACHVKRITGNVSL